MTWLPGDGARSWLALSQPGRDFVLRFVSRRALGIDTARGSLSSVRAIDAAFVRILADSGIASALAKPA